MSLPAIVSAILKALSRSKTPAAPSEAQILATAIGHVISGRATPPDALDIVDFVWTVAVDVNPGLLALSSAEGFAVSLAALISEGLAGGVIQPDTDPVHDAQTKSSPHMGRGI